MVFCLVSVSVLYGDLLCVCFSIVGYFALCLFQYSVVFCLVFVSGKINKPGTSSDVWCLIKGNMS